MAKWKELLGTSTGVIIDADTAFAVPTFTPAVNGTLIEVEVIAGGIAATTKIETGYIKLTSGQWAGRDLYVPFQGGGLETVPKSPKPINKTPCNLPCQAGKPIKLFYYNNVVPTTPEFFVYGTFEG